ncbi:MAG: tetratricopeptide repeat protein [Phycisphaeraceae bacterium]
MAFVPQAVAQQPSAMAKLKTTEVKLPSTAEEKVALGGGGRYLILHFKQLRRLGVFDLKENALAGYVSAADDRVMFAANATHLFVCLGGSGTMSRYKLETREREVSVPFSQEVKAIAAGHASEGPLVVIAGERDGRCRLYDVKTLKPMTDMRVSGNRGHGGDGAFEVGTIINVSADGQVIGGTRTGVSPSGVYVARIGQDSVELRYEHNSMGPIRPDPSGQKIYAAAAVLNIDLKPIGPVNAGLLIPEITQGAFHFKLAPASRNAVPNLSLHISGNDLALINVDLTQFGFKQFPSHPVQFQNTPWHERLFFHAGLKTLVVIPDDRQRLVVAPLDIKTVLDESGLDYLFVSSQPPTKVKSGDKVEYPIQVASKRGSVKLSLEAGAADMKLSPEGKFTWEVPDGAKDETVIILVTDATGQEVYHTFKIAVISPRTPATAAVKPPPDPGIDNGEPPSDPEDALIRREIQLSIELARLYKSTKRDDLAARQLRTLIEQHPDRPEIAAVKAVLKEWTEGD